jgi:guanosine-3',5'-bis(diphosphate) 3'-pyrophosphohydrolase
MIRFEDILESVKSYQPNSDLLLLRKAYVFSAMEHKGQTRRSGEPYLIHPLEVAAILAEMKMEETCIAVGLLHDIVEDTFTTIEYIQQYFGPEIARLIEGVTKISKIKFVSDEERQAENFRKMFLAMADDFRVIIVKFADRLHNMRTLQHLPPESQIRIARETLDIYAPLTHRLGMGKLKSELEDLSFQYLEPTLCENLTQKIENERKVSNNFINEVKTTVEKKLMDQNINAAVEGRIKGIYSIWQKMRRQKISLNEVYDYVAFRIIVDTVRDCYGSLGIIHQLWIPVPERIKDYISVPKPNMYQSLHTSVVNKKGQIFEIQIRTQEMHQIAEEGIAAHWKYKEGKREDRKEYKAITWLRQLVESQKELTDPREFMNSLRINLYPEEIYTFTPKGLVEFFILGSTPLDFAYRIHSEIGDHCMGAKVNGKLVPLNTKLNNGDVVEILTSPKIKPSRDWLAIVKTSRAKEKIRNWLRKHETEQSLDLGRQILEKELHRHHKTLKKIINEDSLLKAATSLHFNDVNTLISSVGYGKTSAQEVMNILFPTKAAGKKETAAEGLGKMVRRVFHRAEKKVQVKVKGMDGLLIYLAKCCNPIPGERIFGYITRGKGISVHSEFCSNVEILKSDPERIIEVAWETDLDAAHPVKLSLYIEDRQGILAKIVNYISDNNTNIINIEAQTSKGDKGYVNIMLQIKDINHLDRIISDLKTIDGILEVERVMNR